MHAQPHPDLGPDDVDNIIEAASRKRLEAIAQAMEDELSQGKGRSRLRGRATDPRLLGRTERARKNLPERVREERERREGGSGPGTR